MFNPTDRVVRRMTAYADDSDDVSTDAPTEDAFIIPEDLTALTAEDLTSLHGQAVEHFDALYGDGTGLADGDLEALAALTAGIESLNAEVATRDAADTERATTAAELAARIRPADEASADTDTDVDEDTDGEDSDPADADETAEAAATVTASSRGEIRVPMSNVRSRARAHRPAPLTAQPQGIRDVVTAGADASGYTSGQGMDFTDLGKAVDRRLAMFNVAQYRAANAAGQVMREQHSLAVIRTPFEDDLTINSNDADHVETVLRHATDQARLKGGSLVASGGWCAPSEILYGDFLELESRDGLISVPQVGVARGGFSFTKGPLFSEIFAGTGFSYTEQEDIDGDYDGEGGGSKPCYKVPCPDFEEVRLNVDGLCITAGLLQQRGYPEVIARTLRGALVAHDHKMAVHKITAMIAGSDAVTMTASQVGATAPLLSSIEMQAEHTRYIHRLARSTVLEAVFPYWVRGVVRSDLSRRLGVDLISVPDARIDSWFRELGISPQFIYNYQDLTGDADAFVAWPTSVQFLMYPAGTWVNGTSDVITLDTIYDSVNLGTNDYTALFTEEGWLMAKRGIDSRAITVDLCGSGHTGGGVGIECDGTATPAA